MSAGSRKYAYEISGKMIRRINLENGNVKATKIRSKNENRKA